MNINKAIRKQKKTYKRFMLSMCFIFVLLPIALMISNIMSMFFIIYLICIEVMITFVLLLRINEEYIDFKQNGYKISIWCGITRVKFIIICKKVDLVHTEGHGRNLKIIIITKSGFRNKRIRPVDINFFMKYPYVAKMYIEIKTQNLEKTYYYLVINNGGFRKYSLLNDLYKTCNQAVFSDDAIENIKEYRE
ncbi:hypothetical protein [Clostridium estertheticum]|uniref:Transmembrane protein n=1 Tax=Clostridium estertheticum subsp. estertheticum TaxID=1552 RepID=A0A1J0GBW7_9CLOT|nr:hypothetical protein [Clostridium estertheticum]APC38771.1 hypothetical protein A7L45_01125 [Clostridium estertheticum subsp. estertheticum]MBU3074618.1 hypothetical protein [Clostridium estertheticum]MBU3164670.1 hypothetical protein [Clostridium estertheticum]MBU3171419.1 hypothetical protein [Clostridium estertheticum]MBU3185592.1 hypothetical protein [Clostridium estertheticum]